MTVPSIPDDERAELAEALAWEIWHRAADVAGVDPYADRTTLAGDQARAAALAELARAETAAAEATRIAVAAARWAAQHGADYAELAAAAGLNSRQAARRRWPGLAELAERARTAGRRRP